MRLFAIILGLYNVIYSFPGLYEPLYFSHTEYEQLMHNDSYVQALSAYDQKRLRILLQKQEEIFWHVSDVYIGKNYKKNEMSDKYLSNFFNFDDFLSKSGKKIKIVMIDAIPESKEFKEKLLSQRQLNSPQFCTNSNLLAITSSDWSSLVDFLPKKMKNFEMTHGFQNFHLIKQLAPENVEIITLSIFDDDGYANKQDFLDALRYITTLKPDILHLALKFVDFDLKNKIDKQIYKELKKISYVVAAAGNDGSSKEAYPARLDCVTLDVGAYDKNHNMCEFSQYEKGVGPKIVAPGSNIVSLGLVPDKDEPQLVMNSGTSMSAALVTGFLATMLSHFSSCFTRQQILTIIYNCTDQRLKGSLLGALDMRMCFFACNVLKRLQKADGSEIMKHKHFKRTLERILLLNKNFQALEAVSEQGGIEEFVKKIKLYASDRCLREFLEVFCSMLRNDCVMYRFVDNRGAELLKNSKSLDRSVIHRLRYPLNQRIKGEK